MAKVKLSKERFDELLAAERIFHDLLPELDNLEACGEDCEGMKQLVRDELERSSKIKQYFAPSTK